MKSAADAAAAMSTILDAVASGDVTPGEGTARRACGALGPAKTLETTELEARIATLEAQHGKSR